MFCITTFIYCSTIIDSHVLLDITSVLHCDNVFHQIKNCRTVILQDLDTALAEHTPTCNTNPGVFELPPLSLDGIPTPVDKMTQVGHSYVGRMYFCTSITLQNSAFIINNRLVSHVTLVWCLLCFPPPKCYVHSHSKKIMLLKIKDLKKINRNQSEY